MNTYFEYLHSLTINTRPATLALLPKAQAASPVSPAILCARYLGTRRVDKPDGSHVIREMWSHKCFEFVGYTGTEYARIRDMHGTLTLPCSQVQGLPAMAEMAA